MGLLVTVDDANNGQPTPPSPLTSMRRHWFTTAVISLVGLAGGVAGAGTQPTLYTAEAQLAVGGQDIANYLVPGFAEAATKIASNYARYVTMANLGDAVTDAVGADKAQITALQGSPIPESNIVRVEVTAETADVARVAAQAVADGLSEQINTGTRAETPDSVLAEYEAISLKAAAAQSRVDASRAKLSAASGDATATDAEIEAARAGYQAALNTLAPLQLRQDALGSRYQNLVSGQASGATTLTVSSPAAIVTDNKKSKMQRYGLVGLVAGLLLSLVVATALERRSTRRRQRSRSARQSDRQRQDPQRQAAEPTTVNTDAVSP